MDMEDVAAQNSMFARRFIRLASVNALTLVWRSRGTSRSTRSSETLPPWMGVRGENILTLEEYTSVKALAYDLIPPS
jgi:hypothetical protein